MLFTIDIENKSSSFGLFDKEKLVTNFKITTDSKKSVDEIRLTIKLILIDKGYSLDDIDEIIISNVVPELSPVYDEIARSITNKNPILISSGVKTGINIKCENPKEVGSDRISRAVAANNIYKKDTIIIYASTITTIDFINNKKEFLGGLIMPGIDLFQKSLVNESAKLPQVEIKKIDPILGKSTTSSIQAGLFHAYINAISEIVDEILKSYKLDKDQTAIVVTGSHADLLNDLAFKNVRDLGLYGLKVIYDLNK